jgi:hypothetical protein
MQVNAKDAYLAFSYRPSRISAFRTTSIQKGRIKHRGRQYNQNFRAIRRTLSRLTGVRIECKDGSNRTTVGHSDGIAFVVLLLLDLLL